MKTILEESVIPYLKQNFDLTETLKVRILHTSGAGEGWIDEKISDLEKLINPTVGLAAHSGIVDIRIAAMANNNEKAEELIRNLEIEIRSRLGVHIFGSDATTLEKTALEAAVACGWTVSSVENDTAGLLFQRLSTLKNTAYLGASDYPLNLNSLKQIVDTIRSEKKADVILGLLVNMNDNISMIHIVIHTPTTNYEHQVNYSGHPQNAPILGVNLILDRLRRIALNANSSN